MRWLTNVQVYRLYVPTRASLNNLLLTVQMITSLLVEND
jgi:hypothetical protein